MIVMICAGECAAAERTPGEYEVKAAYVRNLLNFVEWPKPLFAKADAVTMCLLGRLPDRNAFDELQGQDAIGKKLTIRHIDSIADSGPCQVLFIGPSEERDLPRIVRFLQGTGTLTIGDTPGYAQNGVIINFYLDQNKIRFEINAASARKTGLSISSKLLKLANVVYGLAPSGD